MSTTHDQTKDLLSPAGMLLDAALSLVFFVVFTLFIIPSHVPFQGQWEVLFFSAFCSLPLALVFWISLGLFRVTLMDFRKQPQRSEHKYPQAH